MKKSLLEGLIQILTEAPMSDEDREDSAALRAIFQKRSNRRNAKLTKDELALLDKYGVKLDGQGIEIPDESARYGRHYVGDVDNVLEIGKSKRWSGEDNYDKVNLADIMRKRPNREYAREVRNTYVDTDIAGIGNDEGHYDARRKRGWKDSFQDQERTKVGLEDKYYKDTNYMKNAIRARNDSNRSLANYDTEKKEIDDRYEQALKKAERQRKNDIDYLNRSNEYDLRRRKEASQAIDDIKDKYRRTKTEAFEISKRYYAYVLYWDYKGEPKRKLIEDNTIKGVVKKLRAFAEKYDINEVNRVSKSVYDNEEYQNVCSEFGIKGHSIDLFS